MRVHRLIGLVLGVVLLTGMAALAVERLDGSQPAAEDASVLVAWTAGGLPDGFGAAVAGLDGVVAASVVRGDVVDLAASWDRDGNPVDRPPAGMVIPLDALAVDPRKHAALSPAHERAVFAGLEPGEALLSESAARLRGLGEGATLELAGGERVRVADVVSDDVVAHAEVVLPAPTAAVPTERYVHVLYEGERDAVEAAISAVAGGEAVAVRGPGDQAVLRSGGSLPSQVALKERFGEFAFRRGAGRGITQDDAWVDEHIRVARVPIIGEVACHRAVLPALRGAMAELSAAGLAALVDPGDYAGCYSPRLIRPGEGLSRHAWGIAVDLNATTNAFGQRPTMDPRVVDTMARWGFTWGGTWLAPDGMHFEYVDPPPEGG